MAYEVWVLYSADIDADGNGFTGGLASKQDTLAEAERSARYLVERDGAVRVDIAERRADGSVGDVLTLRPYPFVEIS